MKTRVVLDLKDHPTYGFGPRMTTWWGTLAFCALEGMGFALVSGSYLYLAYLSESAWPIGAAPPDLMPGIVFSILLLASLLPNHWLKQAAVKKDLRRVRIGLVVMSLLGLVLLGVRVFEFPALNIWWDTNAYGSMLWLILALHTVHLATDVGDTLVVTVLMFTKEGRVPRRFTDVEDNGFYWYFVVGSWVPLYVLLYWFQRI
ncbi:cytochrome c oxidase subunit 3 [Terrihabitans rhizophilus]|uniref:Cytochrome c oxidase subunit 3 n=1 Tax=Terrihabitans rhizophilus TaxID=3092662 RepID=A0ABU4RL20_9HYPH|nr:cytochrome c oxidase subunit 3 [Terrihabitans sp. PJ23]MDX6805517.1 cytochrome c oxidase subunit 3 [Terrihabitans sp. PJ23]